MDWSLLQQQLLATYLRSSELLSDEFDPYGSFTPIIELIHSDVEKIGIKKELSVLLKEEERKKDFETSKSSFLSSLSEGDVGNMNSSLIMKEEGKEKEGKEEKGTFRHQKQLDNMYLSTKQTSSSSKFNRNNKTVEKESGLLPSKSYSEAEKRKRDESSAYSNNQPEDFNNKGEKERRRMDAEEDSRGGRDLKERRRKEERRKEEKEEKRKDRYGSGSRESHLERSFPRGYYSQNNNLLRGEKERKERSPPAGRGQNSSFLFPSNQPRYEHGRERSRDNLDGRSRGWEEGENMDGVRRSSSSNFERKRERSPYRSGNSSTYRR